MHKESLINIIIADDDEDDRELFSDIIHKVNGPVKLLNAANSLELLDQLVACSEKLPDLVFLDLNMPGKDGRECLHELKANSKFNQVRIIVCSTSSSVDDINYAYENGADLYLIKPNQFNTYFNLLKHVLILFLSEKLPIRDRHKFVLNVI